MGKHNHGRYKTQTVETIEPTATSITTTTTTDSEITDASNNETAQQSVSSTPTTIARIPAASSASLTANQIPVGTPKSGRTWKIQSALSSRQQFNKGNISKIQRSFMERRCDRELQQVTRTRSQALLDASKARRMQRLQTAKDKQKRREENERQNDIRTGQRLTTATVKRMSKLQRKALRKA